MSYTREIKKKIAQIKAKQAEIEALEDDIRIAAFKHVLSITEGDVLSFGAPDYIDLRKWSNITITLKNGKEKRLSMAFLKVVLDGKKPILMVGREETDIFKIKKIEIC